MTNLRLYKGGQYDLLPQDYATVGSILNTFITGTIKSLSKTDRFIANTKADTKAEIEENSNANGLILISYLRLKACTN